MKNCIAFVDVETGGLPPFRPDGSEDYTVYEVLDVAIRVVEPWPNGDVLLANFEQKFRMTPEQKAQAQKKALEVNGYNDEPGGAWENAPLIGSDAWKTYWGSIRHLLLGTILCSQNVGFDRGYLIASLVKAGAIEVKKGDLDLPWQRRHVDLYSYSHAISEELRVLDERTGKPSWGLHPVYKAMNGPTLPEHQAMPDVQRGQYVYRRSREAFYDLLNGRCSLHDVKTA